MPAHLSDSPLNSLLSHQFAHRTYRLHITHRQGIPLVMQNQNITPPINLGREVPLKIDVIAPDRKTAASVLGNFKQVVKDGDLRLHPIIARLVDQETLEKMGAQQSEAISEKVMT